MLYDNKSGKGIKRQTIPGPNPRKVELSRKSTINDVYSHAKLLYFDEKANSEDMYLADSGGVVVQIDQSKWILEDYYKEHDYKPSRHKLYVVYNSEAVSLFYKYNVHFTCKL